jgi:mannose-6-phosphate isomerase-like protein (cupin superfamily)
MNVINLKEKFDKFDEIYSPKIISELNDYHIKLGKLLGDFVWHSHKETDEAFIIVEGCLEMHFRDKIEILNEGELIVVPKGVEHKPYAKNLCKVLLIEPNTTVNTGDSENEMTKKDLEWI